MDIDKNRIYELMQEDMQRLWHSPNIITKKLPMEARGRCRDCDNYEPLVSQDEAQYKWHCRKCNKVIIDRTPNKL